MKKDDPHYERTLVTKENWDDYADTIFMNGTGFIEYLKANSHIVTLLGNMLVTAKNFAELKNELTLLYNERKEFIDYADNNFPTFDNDT